MGCFRFKSLAVIIAIVSMLIVACTCPASAQGPSPSQCARERQQGIDFCKGMIFGQPPSAACCRVIRTGHFECACPVIDAKLAALLDVNKVVKVLRECRRAVPRRFKCGSLTFP